MLSARLINVLPSQRYGQTGGLAGDAVAALDGLLSSNIIVAADKAM